MQTAPDLHCPTEDLARAGSCLPSSCRHSWSLLMDINMAPSGPEDDVRSSGKWTDKFLSSSGHGDLQVEVKLQHDIRLVANKLYHHQPGHVPCGTKWYLTTSHKGGGTMVVLGPGMLCVRV